MPQEDLQINSQDNPDETAAVLSFATKLSEQLLPKAPQTQETGPTSDVEQENEPAQEEIVQEEPVEEEPDEEIEKLTQGFSEFKGEVKGMIESKFNDLSKTIKDALKD